MRKFGTDKPEFMAFTLGDAKKVYTNCTAAALRAKECVMDTANRVQEAAEDIYAEAQAINAERAAEELFEDLEEIDDSAFEEDSEN